MCQRTQLKDASGNERTFVLKKIMQNAFKIHQKQARIDSNVHVLGQVDPHIIHQRK